jgi:hypothetical protein
MRLGWRKLSYFFDYTAKDQSLTIEAICFEAQLPLDFAAEIALSLNIA